MFKVGLCEDEKIFRDQLTELVKQYFDAKGEKYAIDTYEKGEQLLEVEHTCYSIMFLDVEIKNGMNGLELAKKLRELNHTSFIVFITSHQEEAYKAFEVDAFRYLIKPVQKEKLFEVLDILIQKIKALRNQIVILKTGQNLVKLHMSEILYIETVERKVKICTLKKDYIADNKISELDAQLIENDFFRVHKSYLVNMAYIKEHTHTEVTMQNGIQIFISRLKLASFKKQFVMYLRRKSSAIWA